MLHVLIHPWFDLEGRSAVEPAADKVAADETADNKAAALSKIKLTEAAIQEPTTDQCQYVGGTTRKRWMELRRPHYRREYNRRLFSLCLH